MYEDKPEAMTDQLSADDVKAASVHIMNFKKCG